MKQHVFVIILFALIGTGSAAQVTTYINVGGGISTFNRDLKDLAPVPSVGISCKTRQTPGGLSFTPACLYQQRAQRSELATDYHFTTRMHTLNIELPFEYRSPAGLTFNLGYFHGVNLGSRTVADLNGERVREKITMSDDIGALLSLGYSAGRWAVKATYKNGLINVADGAYSRSLFLQVLWAIRK